MNTGAARICTSLAIFLPLALIFGAAPMVQAAPGDLDPTFDGDGKVTLDFNSSDGLVLGDSAYDVTVDSAGRIVVAGWANNRSHGDFAVARLNSTGSLDPSFGADGKVTTDISGCGDAAHAVEIDAIGRIVVGGYATTDCYQDYDFAVVRYNSDESLDTSFGGDGIVTAGFPYKEDWMSDMAVDIGGRLVVVGSSGTYEGRNFAIARVNSDGTLDSSFGVDGMIVTQVGELSSEATSVAMDELGRIVVGGYALVSGEYHFAVVRYNSDGSLDPTFDGDGMALTDIGAVCSDEIGMLAIDDAGRIVVIGVECSSGRPDFAVVRYNSDGTIDLAFGGGDGIVTTDFAGRNDYAYAVALDETGRIVVAGKASITRPGSPPDWDFALARYNSDGSLDTTFGVAGKMTTDFIGSDWANGMTLDASGRIVAVGIAGVGGWEDFAIARYLGDKPLQTRYFPLVRRT